LITISAFDTPNLESITLQSLLELPEEELDKNGRPYLTTTLTGSGWVVSLLRQR
jgi:hypothetical protein